jgi:hypothetical protein
MATPTSGTFTISDLQAVNDVSILEFGEETIAEVVQRDLQRFNAQVDAALSLLADPITDKADRLARYGTSVNGDMVELDEMGRPAAKKSKPGVNVGFPLRKYGFAAGFTRDYMLQRTPADVAVVVTTAQKAYWRRIRLEIQRALHLSANYTFVDRFVDDVSLPVKRLVNADSAEIPDGPNGETFTAASHTHYDANNGWDNTALTTSIANLTEHGHTDNVVMAINKADESAVRALASFEAYLDPRVTHNTAANEAQSRLQMSNTGDRAIGIFGDAEVWVKPWAIDNYAIIFASGDAGKPLKFRQHNAPGMRGLRLAATIDDYPLRADIFEAYLGFGVWTRTNGVIHYAGGASWTDATIAK